MRKKKIVGYECDLTENIVDKVEHNIFSSRRSANRNIKRLEKKFGKDCQLAVQKIVIRFMKETP